MLYQFYEAQRALMEPFAEFALASSKMLANPVSLFHKFLLFSVFLRRMT